jgi:hypothetical protein
LLYIRNHPGHFIEPMSHQKIYLNWRPPDTNEIHDFFSQTHQRDILNAMTQEIRKGALRQIIERSAPPAWHPDSLTGITESAAHEQEQQYSEEIRKIKTSLEDLAFIDRESNTNRSFSETTGSTFHPLTSFIASGGVNFGNVRRGQHKPPPHNAQPHFDVFEDDSDDGGVPL